MTLRLPFALLLLAIGAIPFSLPAQDESAEKLKGAYEARVLLSRGPDVVLQKGTMLEMVLDRELQFEEHELQFPASSPVRTTRVVDAPEQPAKRSRWSDIFGLPS